MPSESRRCFAAFLQGPSHNDQNDEYDCGYYGYDNGSNNALHMNMCGGTNSNSNANKIKSHSQPKTRYGILEKYKNSSSYNNNINVNCNKSGNGNGVNESFNTVRTGRSDVTGNSTTHLYSHSYDSMGVGVGVGKKKTKGSSSRIALKDHDDGGRGSGQRTGLICRMKLKKDSERYESHGQDQGRGNGIEPVSYSFQHKGSGSHDDDSVCYSQRSQVGLLNPSHGRNGTGIGADDADAWTNGRTCASSSITRSTSYSGNNRLTSSSTGTSSRGSDNFEYPPLDEDFITAMEGSKYEHEHEHEYGHDYEDCEGRVNSKPSVFKGCVPQLKKKRHGMAHLPEEESSSAFPRSTRSTSGFRSSFQNGDGDTLDDDTSHSEFPQIIFAENGEHLDMEHNDHDREHINDIQPFSAYQRSDGYGNANPNGHQRRISDQKSHSRTHSQSQYSQQHEASSRYQNMHQFHQHNHQHQQQHQQHQHQDLNISMNTTPVKKTTNRSRSPIKSAKEFRHEEQFLDTLANTLTTNYTDLQQNIEKLTGKSHLQRMLEQQQRQMQYEQEGLGPNGERLVPDVVGFVNNSIDQSDLVSEVGMASTSGGAMGHTVDAISKTNVQLQKFNQSMQMLLQGDADSDYGPSKKVKNKYNSANANWSSDQHGFDNGHEPRRLFQVDNGNYSHSSQPEANISNGIGNINIHANANTPSRYHNEQSSRGNTAHKKNTASRNSFHNDEDDENDPSYAFDGPGFRGPALALSEGFEHLGIDDRIFTGKYQPTDTFDYTVDSVEDLDADLRSRASSPDLEKNSLSNPAIAQMEKKMLANGIDGMPSPKAVGLQARPKKSDTFDKWREERRTLNISNESDNISYASSSFSSSRFSRSSKYREVQGPHKITKDDRRFSVESNETEKWSNTSRHQSLSRGSMSTHDEEEESYSSYGSSDYSEEIRVNVNANTNGHHGLKGSKWISPQSVAERKDKDSQHYFRTMKRH